uniref:TIL domain-containing protein n=1 Tax=Steinernema glaseri TaxID=37863 RepID=A0A1I7YD63_9BILA
MSIAYFGSRASSTSIRGVTSDGPRHLLHLFRNMKLLFFFFVLCCSVCVADKLTDFPDDPRCGKNEMWTRCGCESTCGVDRPCYGMRQAITMRSFFFVFALALALVSVQSLEEKHCGKNEYFSTSTCNVCDPPCSNPGHYVCPLICHPPKCMCKEGFCRDSNNRCVTPPQTLRMLSSLGNVEQLKKIPQT